MSHTTWYCAQAGPDLTRNEKVRLSCFTNRNHPGPGCGEYTLVKVGAPPTLVVAGRQHPVSLRTFYSNIDDAYLKRNGVDAWVPE